MLRSQLKIAFCAEVEIRIRSSQLPCRAWCDGNSCAGSDKCVQPAGGLLPLPVPLSWDHLQDSLTCRL